MRITFGCVMRDSSVYSWMNRDRCSLVALPLAQLDALRHDDRLWQQYQEWFYQFSHCWQQRGVLALIRQLVQQFQVAERVLADAGGERDALEGEIGRHRAFNPRQRLYADF